MSKKPFEKDISLMPRIPTATYRLQFNSACTFGNAASTIPYLSGLGITDLYASPYLKAREGSSHGYDIVDHTVLNPELGSKADYEALCASLKAEGMGQLLDIVPNHMCIESAENTWWNDILENGPSSSYASFFDIDWDPVKRELHDKIMLPVLGDQYGKVLERKELQIIFRNGGFFVGYYDHVFPIRPQTYVLILEPGIARLQKRLSQNHPDVVELLSILTAAKNLPSYTEVAPERCMERMREKEVIKKRLDALSRSSTEIRMFIDQTLEDLNGNDGEPRSFDRLDLLLNQQIYRFSYWRVATEEINYRRFFDINGLGAIRAEVPEVFRATHALVMKLVRNGVVTGLRVDHPDGLYDPSAYFHLLQRTCLIETRLGNLERIGKESSIERDEGGIQEQLHRQYDDLIRTGGPLPFYIIGEKILSKGERMPEEWPIFSTTGYVFLNTLNGIFVRTDNARSFDDIYRRFTGLTKHFQDIAYESKKLIMHVAMSSEVNTIGHYLNRLSEKDRHTRDFTLYSLTRAILEVIACFPVYRTYVTGAGVTDRDRQYIEAAVSKAKRRNPAISASVFDFLRDVLLLRYPDYFGESERREWLDFVMRFQQITGPVMAKGVEDTACYIYNRLVSINEVGGIPDRFGVSLDTFHGQNIERSKHWPHALIATSTHDTKRSEDVRARINVLSELPGEWRQSVFFWSRINRKKKPVVDGQRVPDRNEEYLFYQTLIGTWPFRDGDQEEYARYVGRIKDYMLKAVREAKVNTSWISPYPQYEEAVMLFIDEVLKQHEGNQFLREFMPFQQKIAHFGAFNSLSQVLLKIASPGVPDFYQGSDLFDFRLVDPDNRNPADFGVRKEFLEKIRMDEREHGAKTLLARLLNHKEDGKIKLYLTWKALQFRKAKSGLFSRGDYQPLELEGKRAEHVCAFARRLGQQRIVVAVPRFFAGLIDGPQAFPVGALWSNTDIIIPYADVGIRYRDIFTGEVMEIRKNNGARVLPARRVFEHAPFALLERIR